MADAGFFKGTSADQDRRFSDKELKLLKTMKFPPEFDKKVDMRKVNLSVIRPWIVKKVVELVGFEDEVVVEYAMGLLEDDSQPTPDPRKMQINLTGFLTSSTPAFMSALWNLLLEAQDSPAGVPRTFVEEKKEEMRQAKAGDTRAFEERDRRARLDEIRANEREARGGGRGRGRGRGRGGSRFDDDRGHGDRPRDSGWGMRGGVRTSRLSRPIDTDSCTETRWPSPFSPASSRSRSRTPRRLRSPPRGGRSLGSPPRRSPSRSRSPPPGRRRPRSPSISPAPSRDRRVRGSRSPPPRRRRLSTRSRSRSRSPPPPYRGGYGRRRSPSMSRSPPRRRRRSISLDRDRSPPPRRRSPPRRKGRTPSRDSVRSRTMDTASERPGTSGSRNADKMEVDGQGNGGELKIRGQADAEHRKDQMDVDHTPEDRAELERRESELKEKALRNKVVRTRKSSAATANASTSNDN
ncbi:hypothetical protein C8T65DRAFT_761911 [Cerioporus squamosus]|nr:hypothetical protein C8T65DRAFT_761911 [Cerioporus squamosus]